MIKKKGIDISNHQSGIDLKIIAPQVDFIILRSSHGVSSVDTCFEKFYVTCKELKVPVGVYHYFYYGDEERHNGEMANFLKQIAGKNFDLPVFIDYEESQAKYAPPLGAMGKEKITEYMLADYKKIKAAGFKPGIYANKNWLTNYIDNSKIPDDMTVWLAQYADAPTYTGRYNIWQFSSSGMLSGYAGRLDFNYLYQEEPQVETDVKTYSLAKDGDTKLSKNFSVKEFRCRDGSDKVLISSKTVDYLQKIRDHFGKPVTLNSGYRTPTYNKSIGGSPKSQHMYGRAADITVKDVSLEDVYLYAEQLGVGGLGYYDTFVHIDSRDDHARWNESNKPTPVLKYKIKVSTAVLRKRSGPGTTYTKKGFVYMNSIQTIIKTQGVWGQLESDKSWINLDYVKKI